MTDASTPDSPIDQLTERHLVQYVALQPTDATALGIPGHDHELPDYTPAGFQALAELTGRSVAEAQAIQPGSPREEVAKDAFLERLGLELERYEAGVPQHQLNAIASVPAEIRQVFDLMSTETDEDWETIAIRLNQVGTALDGYRETVLEQADLGRVSAVRQVNDLANRIASWTGADGDDFFAGLAAHAPDSAVKPEVEAAAASARKSFQQFGAWLTAELAPRAPQRDACGREVYQLASRTFLGATIDFEETYAWGWAELARIEADMQAIAADLNGGDRSIEATAALLDDDPARKIHGKEAFRDWMQEKSDGAVAELGGKHFDIPDQIRTLQCMIAPTSDGAIYYTPPSEDLTRPGRTWWPLGGRGDDDRFETWSELSTVFHEGVPGHHLQAGAAKMAGDRLSRFARTTSVSGHGEGWALYAERLADELGWFERPGTRLGMLSGSALRAVRVVIDIGVHLDLPLPDGSRWTFGRACEMLREHGRAEPYRVEPEVIRYFGWPGQAISYKLGERGWLAAREQAMRRPGPRGFDLKRWHTAALSLGPIGLDALTSELARA